MPDIPKTYDQSKESQVYKLWESSGYFNPDNLEGEPYTIVMPPLNANASPHVGHALGMTLEDIMIRYHRMLGKKALWLPGTDHAGFETQVVFEKKLEKEGRSRFQMTREEFYKEVWDFVQLNKHVTEEGIRRLGASCDWSRNTFTLDPKIVQIVYDTFKQMHADGLVYRGSRICNWCVKHQTNLADLETKYEEKTDALYYIKYGPFTLATVRPETKFGDTALAVNPNDARYKKYVGQEIEAEGLLGKFKLKVIADEAVDTEFGTGVVKVTPAHDPLDYEIWQRHKDEIPPPKQVIDTRGKMDLPETKYHGLKVAEARKIVAEDLQKAGLIEKVDENYKHNVQVCYKCSNNIEPLIMPQWFLAMTKKTQSPKSKIQSSLRDAAVSAIKSGEIKIMPERFKKVFMHWMDNIRDWPISRQIWWGIPIPVWTKECEANDLDIFHILDIVLPVALEDLLEGEGDSCSLKIIDSKSGKKIHTNVSEFNHGLKIPITVTVILTEDDESKISKGLERNGFLRDPDTFDTWFSSGQWPYATLMANQPSDFKTFYPTQVMETGWDILFFWVARMIMFGLYKTGKVPFETVYLHGLVRDKDKQKMSKSKGNVVDPLGVIDQYGVDALRMALTVDNLAGNDLPLSEDKVRGYRNFANKIWNAARFVLTNCLSPSGGDVAAGDREGVLTKEDQTILDELAHVVASTTKLMNKYDFAHASENLYHYFWHTFADKIIEESKAKLADPQTKKSAQVMLITVLETSLKLLHPFMPFVTETIWQRNHKDLLMIQKWPGTESGK